MKYRKKPIEVEVFQFNGSSTAVGVVKHWMETGELIKPQIWTQDCGRTISINTKEGEMLASAGDYIIKEPFDKERGFYPCKPDIFGQTYEPVGD